jgi:hypothetical protein
MQLLMTLRQVRKSDRHCSWFGEIINDVDSSEMNKKAIYSLTSLVYNDTEIIRTHHNKCG